MQGASRPTVPQLADELWSVAVSGLINIDARQLQGLASLGVLCRPGTVPPARTADIQRGLRIYVRRAGRQAELRQRCELLLGATAATASLSLEHRLEAVGRTYVSRRGGGGISGKTVRNSGRAKAIVEELADLLLAAEAVLEATGEHPAAGAESIYAPRALFAVAAEERLGYRWLGYDRCLRGPDTQGHWDDQTRLMIEVLRPGVRQIEIEFQAPEDGNQLDVLWLSLDGATADVTKIEPAPYMLPTPYYIGVRDRPWWRGWIESSLDLPQGEPIEMILRHATASDEADFAYNEPEAAADLRRITTIAVTPLFDTMTHLRLSFEMLGVAPENVDMFSREVLAIGNYRFTGRDDVTVAKTSGATITGAFETATPSAGMGYELNVAVR